MLRDKRQKALCESPNKYLFSRSGCFDCPLRVGDPEDLLCKAIAHYDKEKKMWVRDIQKRGERK